MKVIGFNGSPNKNGNTYNALKMVLDEIEGEGIETEIFHVGAGPLEGCRACGMCARNKDEKCVIKGDNVNSWIQKIKEADGIILGSPVHFSNITAVMKAFLDRTFYVSSQNGGLFRHKVGASITAVRRSGGIPAFDALNRYILYSEMVMVSANYWNVIHGALAGEADLDVEGRQIMGILGKNMAWLVKTIHQGKKSLLPPQAERKKRMNFIR